MKKNNKSNSPLVKAKGFTLLEIMIVLFLIVILLSWGFPSYQQLKGRRLVSDFTNEIIFSFTQARAEALRYGTSVEVRPRGGRWADGWTTIALGVDGAADVTIASQPAVDEYLQFDASGLLTGKFSFNNFGSLEGPEARLFTLNHANANINDAIRVIRINFNGSAKSVRP